MKHRTRSDKTYSVTAGITVGTAITLGIMFICITIFAYLIVDGRIEESTIRYVALMISALSVYIGVLVSGKSIKKQYAIVGFVQGTIILAVLIGIHLFFFEGPFESVVGTIAVIYIAAASGCLSLMVPRKAQRKKRNR